MPAATFLAAWHGHTQQILAWLAYTAYVMAAAAGILAFAIRITTIVPNPRGLFDDYMQESKATTLAHLAATRVQAYEANKSRHDKKARRWWASLLFLACGVVLMLASIIVHTGHHA